jgi:serpin B
MAAFRSCVAVFSLLFLTVAACADSVRTDDPLDPLTTRELPAELVAGADSLVEANTRFALDLYAELRGAGGNLFLSPFSISTALAMTYAGAAGITEREMRDVLHLGQGPERTHALFQALLSSLDRGIALGGYRLDVANGIWAQAGSPFRDEYLDTVRERYLARIESADFVRAAEAVRGEINRWVAEKTAGRIEELFPPGSLNDLTRLVLANAIYFKGKWDAPFDPKLTRSRSFHLDANRRVEVPMMSQHGTFGFASFDGVEVLEMPYTGKDLSMIFMLPSGVEGLWDLEARMTFEELDRWVSGTAPRPVDVSIPRFHVESEFALSQPLSALGMPSAFDAGLADFSRMTGERDLSVSAVLHKAYVDVNEEGTEAAAATGVVVETTSVPPEFVADHPFLFLIRDNVTGSVLFLGRVTDPS